MSDAAHPPIHGETEEGYPTAFGTVLNLRIKNGKIGLWLFLASEVMFFTGLIGAYIILRAGQDVWLDPTGANYPLNIPLTAANTFLLICSSVTLVWGLQGIQAGDRSKGSWGLFLTTMFGATFVGVQAYEYAILFAEGFTPDHSIASSCFYVMTSFHGLHVFLGVVALAVLTVMSWCGKFTAKNSLIVEATGLYWHFVDLVWIILFAIVYLI